MSKIKKYQDFLNEKNNISESITVKNTGEVDEWDQPLYKDINTGRIYVMVDGKIHSITEEGEPLYPIKDVDIIEDEPSNDSHIWEYEIAKEIESGETGGKDWDLEVKAKDWLKLEVDDIYMIADLIRKGKTEGNDPIDWKLEVYSDEDFEGDIEEEEEDFEDDDSEDDDLDVDTFYAKIEHGDKSSIIKISKEYSDKWVETLICGDDNSYIGQKYMSYLTPFDILSYLRNDYDDARLITKDDVDFYKEELDMDINESKSLKFVKTFEYFTRADIAKHMDLDADEFEDSEGLGDMADRFIDSHAEYDQTKEEAKELFDAYLDNNDVSRYFTDTISKEFKYSRLKSMFDDIIGYYGEFEKEYGYIDSIGTPIFNNILKEIIANFFKERNITEKKKSEDTKMKKKKESSEFYVDKKNDDEYCVYNSDEKDDKCYFTGSKEKAEKFADKKNKKK